MKRTVVELRWEYYFHPDPAGYEELVALFLEKIRNKTVRDGCSIDIHRRDQELLRYRLKRPEVEAVTQRIQIDEHTVSCWISSFETKKDNFYANLIFPGPQSALQWDSLGVTAEWKAIEDRVPEIRREFMEIVSTFPVVYAYCKVVSCPQDTWWFFHTIDHGPSRLEWLNAFGEEYGEILEQAPVELVSRLNGKRGKAFFVEVGGPHPVDYLNVSRRSRYRLEANIGATIFSEAEDSLWRRWRHFVSNPMVYKAHRPAKFVPAGSSTRHSK